MTAIRLGVIGPGLFWHKTHRPVLASLPELFEVVAFCARSEATRAKVLAEDPGRAFYHSYDEMLASAEIEAALVLTPIPLNATVTIAALRAGKDVFVEKPVARTAAEAREALAVIEETGRRVFVLEQVGWDASWRTMREIVESGRLGQVVMFDRASHRCMDDGEHTRGGYGRTSWRVHTDYPLGMMLDGGIHEIAGLRILFGEIERVRAWGQSTRETFGDWDVVQMAFDYASGVRGLFHHSGLLGEGANDFRIRGTEGTLIVDGSGPRIVSLDGQTTEPVDLSCPKPHEAMWRELAANYCDRTAPTYTVDDALADLVTLDRIAESAQTGQEA